MKQMRINVIGHLVQGVPLEHLRPVGREALVDTPEGEEMAQCAQPIFFLPVGVDHLSMTLHHIERALQTPMTGDRASFARE